MEPAGWALLAISWLTISTLAAYCLCCQRAGAHSFELGDGEAVGAGLTCDVDLETEGMQNVNVNEGLWMATAVGDRRRHQLEGQTEIVVEQQVVAVHREALVARRSAITHSPTIRLLAEEAHLECHRRTPAIVGGDRSVRRCSRRGIKRARQGA